MITMEIHNLTVHVSSLFILTLRQLVHHAIIVVRSAMGQHLQIAFTVKLLSKDNSLMVNVSARQGSTMTVVLNYVENALLHALLAKIIQPSASLVMVAFIDSLILTIIHAFATNIILMMLTLSVRHAIILAIPVLQQLLVSLAMILMITEKRALMVCANVKMDTTMVGQKESANNVILLV